MGSAPDLQLELGKNDRLTGRQAQNRNVPCGHHGIVTVDRIGSQRVVIAGKNHDRRRVAFHPLRDPLDQLSGLAVVVERISGQDHDIRSLRLGRSPLMGPRIVAQHRAGSTAAIGQRSQAAGTAATV